MEPVLWWWRWWLGGDPNRDRRTTETLLDEQRRQVTELTEQLESRGAELQELRTQLDQARTAAEEHRTMLMAELDQARAEAAELQHCTDDLARARSEVAQLQARVDELEAQRPPGSTPDIADAERVLGGRIRLDDLTVVDGVGPKIAGLLADAGIDSWRALGDADVAQLRSVLEQAGARYRMHDPTGWPTQGRLLADGRWDEFKELTSG